MKSNFPVGTEEFLRYFEETFIRGRCVRIVNKGDKHIYGKPKYSVAEWNVYNRFEDDLDRTTNAQEAFNRMLQCCNFHGDHPSVYRLSTLLLDVNQRICHQMEEHIIKGAPFPKKKKQDSERQVHLIRLYTKLKDGSISTEDYLFGCSGNLN